MSFGSSFICSHHKTDTVSSSIEEMWLLHRWLTSPQGDEVSVWGQNGKMCHWNGRNVI